MPIEVNCPQCSQMLRVPDTAVGKSVRCPKCQTVFPASAPAASTPPASNDPFGFPASNPPPSSFPPAKDPFAMPGMGAAPQKPNVPDPFGGGSAPNAGPYNPYAPPSASGVKTDDGMGLPWEAQGASFETFTSTIKLIMLEPDRAFQMMRQDNELTKSLSFAVTGIVVGGILGMIWQIPFQIFQAMAIGGQGQNQGVVIAGGLIGMVIGFFVGIVIAVISLFFSSLIMHLFLMLVGAANKEWAVTMRVYCWTSGAFPWMQVIPILGPLVMFFWQIAALVIGLSKAHETSVGKVILAIVLQIVVCGLVIVLPLVLLFVFIFAAANGGAGGGGGGGF